MRCGRGSLATPQGRGVTKNYDHDIIRAFVAAEPDRTLGQAGSSDLTESAVMRIWDMISLHMVERWPELG